MSNAYDQFADFVSTCGFDCRWRNGAWWCDCDTEHHNPGFQHRRDVAFLVEDMIELVVGFEEDAQHAFEQYQPNN